MLGITKFTCPKKLNEHSFEAQLRIEIEDSNYDTKSKLKLKRY